MEELEKLKKRTKKFKCLAIIVLIITIILGIRVFLADKDRSERVRIAKKDDDLFQAKEIFNGQFIGFEGINLSEISIKSLYNKVKESNTKIGEHYVKINGNDAKSFEISNINKNYVYSVKLEYGKDGFINNVIIEENEKENKQKQEIERFNSQFKEYIGQNKRAYEIELLISCINISNSQNANHIVKINHDDAKKFTFSTEYSYNVNSVYDKDGYINEITISPN